jgi:hypothetical protein
MYVIQTTMQALTAQLDLGTNAKPPRHSKICNKTASYSSIYQQNAKEAVAAGR